MSTNAPRFLALAALLTVALAAPAGAAGVPRTADIAVEIEGVQRTAWEAHHVAINDCDVSYDGSGSETYRFRSRKVQLRAIELPNGSVFFTRRGRPAVLPLTGTVTRTGSLLKATAGLACAAGDGTGGPAPAPPDCGTRRVTNAVEIAFGVRVRDRIEISDGEPATDPFKNCPAGGAEQYPTIMAWDGADRRIGRRLPAGDLFGHGRNIVIARGTKTRSGSEMTSTTTVRWTVTLTRVRPR